MLELDRGDSSVIVCRLDGSPLNTIPLRDTSVEKLYHEITKLLPASLAEFRMKEKKEIELYELNSEFLDDVIQHAHCDVGHLYEEYYKGQKFKKRMKITIRELFFQKIVEYGISHKDAKSYHFLDILTFSSEEIVDEDGNITYEEPTPIRLSTLLGHRFDGNEYSFNETNSSYIVLKKSNLKMFTNVVRMMRYLDRKDYALYIDYPQYYQKIDGKSLVQPLPLSELHRTHGKDSYDRKDCTYYSNHWIGSEENKSIHSNSIMAILSYLKYSFNNQ